MLVALTALQLALLGSGCNRGGTQAGSSEPAGEEGSPVAAGEGTAEGNEAAGPERVTAAQAGALFHELGCDGCHGQHGEGGVHVENYPDGTVPPLNTLAERLGLTTPGAAQDAIDLLEQGVDLATLVERPPFPGYLTFVERLQLYRSTIQMGRHTDYVVVNGEAPPHMPAWEDRLTPRQMDALTAYLISQYPWPTGDADE
jgi:mono/diheme cytochrome c family protein